jgi:hypothetical protein
LVAALAALLGACGGGGAAPAPAPDPGPQPNPDTTAPTVLTTSPRDADTDVALGVVLSVEFSEAMDLTTLSDTSFTLEVVSGGASVAGSVNASGTQATFQPAAELAEDTQYRATLTTDVKDLAGNALALEFSWTFTTVAPQPPVVPQLGAHALAYQVFNTNAQSSISVSLSTTPGSTILVCAARGDISQHVLPTDNMGNAPYTQLGTAHGYTLWTTSGTALYTFPVAQGGANHVVTLSKSDPADEVTLAVVEVLNGGVIQDVQWNEDLTNPVTSLSVSTTGPATLVAVWWGDALAQTDQTATPNNGFAVIDSVLLPGNLIQCAVATKDVAAAGTYDVTWTATPSQGAQLWLMAVQKAP